jgi:hypothetical protein
LLLHFQVQFQCLVPYSPDFQSTCKAAPTFRSSPTAWPPSPTFRSAPTPLWHIILTPSQPVFDLIT